MQNFLSFSPLCPLEKGGLVVLDCHEYATDDDATESIFYTEISCVAAGFEVVWH
jgi:hypothetical protein